MDEDKTFLRFVSFIPSSVSHLIFSLSVFLSFFHFMISSLFSISSASFSSKKLVRRR